MRISLMKRTSKHVMSWINGPFLILLSSCLGTGESALSDFIEDPGVTVGQSALSFNPKTLNFGNAQRAPSYQETTVTITNSANQAIFIKEFTIDNTDFSLRANTCAMAPLGLDSGSTCELTLRFSPGADGDRTGTLTASYGTAADESDKYSQTYGISGRSTPEGLGNPALSFTPSIYDYGDVALAPNYQDRTFTLKNEVDIPVYLSGFSSNSGLYTVQSSTCPIFPQKISPDATCSVVVRFSPLTVGTFLSTLSAVYGTDDLEPGSFSADVAVSGSSSSGGLGNPVITFSPDFWDFGDVSLGATVQKTITVTNTHSTSLFISSIASEAVASKFDVLANNCPVGLNPFPAGQTCSIIVTYTPQASESNADNIVVSYGPDYVRNTSLSNRVVVNGRSTPPPISSNTLSFTPGFWDFGDVAANISASKQFVIKNVSTSGIYLGSIDRTSQSNFALSHNCPTSSAIFAANEECTVTVIFTPSADGSYSSDVTVNYGANPPQSSAIQSKFVVIGRSTSTPVGNAVVTFDPSFYDFGDQAVNTNTNQSVTVQNTTSIPLYISSIATPTAQFSVVSNTCPSGATPLAANGTCTFIARFTPDTAGVFSGEIRIAYGTDVSRSSNLNKTMAVVGRSSTGDVGSSALTYLPDYWDFGDTAAGMTVQKEITITNSSTDAVFISNITRSNPSVFGVSHDCPVSPTSLDANSSCSVTVSFSPLADGVQSSLINVLYGPDAPRSNANTSSFTVSGRSTAASRGNPAIAYSPSSWDFGDVPANTAPTKTITLTNVSSSAVYISAVNLSAAGSFLITDNTCPSGATDFAAAATCQVTVRFAPTADTIESLDLQAFYGPDQARSGNLLSKATISGRSLAVPSGQSIFSLSPSFLDFDDVAQNNTVTKSVVITNSSSSSVYISAITRSNTAVYAVSDDCPRSPLELATTTSCTITLNYTPDSEGGHSTRVDVSHGTSSAGSSNLTQSFYAQGKSTAASNGNSSLTFTPDYWDFGDVAAGQSASKQFTIQNTSSAAVNLNTAAVSNPRFTITANTCPSPSTLFDTTDTCTVTVQFNPTADGAQTAALSMSYGPDTARSANLISKISIAGRSTAAPLGNTAIAFTPNYWDFGDVASGQSSQHSILVTNTYSSNLHISGFTSSNSTFAISDNCPRSPSVLAPNTSCSLTTTFTPTADGGQSATVTVSYGPDEARSTNLTTLLSLAGRSTTNPVGNPALAINPTYRDYGNLLIGQNATFTFTLQNTRSDPVYLGPASTSLEKYTITANTCPSGATPLNGDASCTIAVRYAPTIETVDVAELLVSYGPDVYRATNLIAKGTLIGKSELPPVGNSAIVISPNTHDFGNVALAPAYADTTLTITNSSNRNLYLGPFSGLTNPYSIDSTTCPLSPTAFASSDSCTIVVRFSPIAGPQVTQTLSVNYGTADSNTSEFNSQAQFTGRSNPNPPTNFRFANGNATSVTFEWDANDFDQSSFTIERCDGSACAANFSTAETFTGISNTARTYTANSLTEGQIYRFRIRAIQGATSSAWLTSTSTLVFGGITSYDNSSGSESSLSQINCSNTNAAGAYVILNWSSIVNAAYYQVFDVSSGSAVFVKNVDAPANGTVITGLSSHSDKHYLVKAFTTSGVQSTNITTSDLQTINYTPCAAIGQSSMDAWNTAAALQSPRDVVVGDGKMAIADMANNRVLIWNSVPTTSSVPADVVVGQPDFDSVNVNNSGNRASFSLRSSKSLYSPRGVYIKNNKLYVADTSNHRVLIWNTVPTTNFAPADIVLGQINMGDGGAIGTSNCPRYSNGGRRMYNPHSVHVDDDGYLYVGDTSNNRIMIWTSPITDSGQAADIVLGMASYSVNCPGGSRTQRTFNGPQGIFVSGNDVFIADTNNRRIMRFSKPLSNYMDASNVWGVSNFTVASSNNCNYATSYRTPYNLWGDSTSAATAIYVADYTCNRVFKYDSNNWGTNPSPDGVIGQAAYTTSTGGSSATQLYNPIAGFASSSLGVWVLSYSGHRLNKFDAATTPPTAATSTLIIGQPRVGTSMTNHSGISGQRIFRPTSVSIGNVNRRMAINDWGANRVLLYDSIPMNHLPMASRFIGQTTATANDPNRGGSAASNTLKYPFGVWTDGEKLLIADSGNNRVLGWKSWPTSDGQAAQFVLGQSSFTGSGASTSASGLYLPTQVQVTDYPGSSTFDYIWVLDTTNNRLLAYTTTWADAPSDPPVPPASAAAALVIGQATFTTRTAPTTPTQSSLNTPRGFWTDGRRIVIADSANNRVLIWDQATTPSSGANADIVLGQNDFVSKLANQGLATPTLSTLNFPAGITVDDRGTEENTADDRLFVTDLYNHRILVWNSWPTTDGQEADRVIGQINSYNNTTNAGYSYPTDISFRYPSSILFDIGRLFVSDGAHFTSLNTVTNQRVLVFPSY